MQQIIETYGQMLLAAMGKTLTLALCGLFFACLIGLLFGILSVLKNKVCNAIYRVFVDVIRGVPMIVLAFFVYFGVPYIINKSSTTSFTLSALQAGTVCLSLNCGAYMAEIIRAGIQSVDIGQMEAGRAVGLSFATTMVKIVIPQAVKNILPTLGNEFITLIKETSVVSFVGAADLYVAFNYIGSNYYEFMVPYLVMAIIYIAIVMIISLGIKLMERGLARSDRRS